MGTIGSCSSFPLTHSQSTSEQAKTRTGVEVVEQVEWVDKSHLVTHFSMSPSATDEESGRSLRKRWPRRKKFHQVRQSVCIHVLVTAGCCYIGWVTMQFPGLLYGFFAQLGPCKISNEKCLVHESQVHQCPLTLCTDCTCMVLSWLHNYVIFKSCMSSKDSCSVGVVCLYVVRMMVHTTLAANHWTFS